MVKVVSVWEKLKLQVDNLELMHKQKEQGQDVSSLAYWQMETIYEILKSVEEHLGGDEVRKKYEELSKDLPL